MKKWYLIDTARGDTYADDMRTDSREDARRKLHNAWERLTESDRRDRIEFFAIHAELDEDGCVDYDTNDDVIYLDD